MIESGAYDLAEIVREAGARCSRCRSGECARRHGVRYRRRVTEISRGEVHEHLPIVRVRFCDGSTISLPPAELWRGRATVHSVIESVARVISDGVESALRWSGDAWVGEEPFSERTLRRWLSLVRSRVISGSLSWLGPRLGLTWSARAPEALQLRELLTALDASLLLEFRAHFGRAVLDTAASPSSPAPSGARRVRGRLDPTFPPDPPSERLARGQRLRRAGANRPGKDPPQGGEA